MMLPLSDELIDHEVARRMNRWCHVWGQVASIVCETRVPVDTLMMDHPAATDGTVIYLNHTEVTEVVRTGVQGASWRTEPQLAELRGLVMHEVAHILFTPFKVLAVEEMRENTRTAWNILEDARIERMMIGLYPTTRPWLTAAVSRWLTDDMGQPYPLLVGRTWLPRELRQAARDAWAYGFAQEIADIVAEYSVMTDPTTVRAQQLVDDLERVLPFMPPHEVFPNATSSGRKSGKAPAAVARKAQAAANKVAGEDDTSDQFEHQVGSLGDRLREELDEAMSSAVSEVSDQMRSDMEQVVEALKIKPPPSDRLRTNAGWLQSQTFDPSARAVGARNRLHNELYRLVEPTMPAWHRQQPHGRLATQRLIQGRMAGRWVSLPADRWWQGSNARSAEVALLVDLSSSMRAQSRQLSEAVWAMRSAASKLPAIDLTVYGFGSESRLLWGPGARVGERVQHLLPSGSTDPAGALHDVVRLMRYTRHHNRLLIVITDGAWEHYTEPWHVIQWVSQHGSTLLIDIRDGKGLTIADVVAQRRSWMDRGVPDSLGFDEQVLVPSMAEAMAPMSRMITRALARRKVR